MLRVHLTCKTHTLAPVHVSLRAQVKDMLLELDMGKLNDGISRSDISAYVSDAFTGADHDGNGVIDFHEFTDYYNSMQARAALSLSARRLYSRSRTADHTARSKKAETRSCTLNSHSHPPLYSLLHSTYTRCCPTLPHIADYRRP